MFEKEKVFKELTELNDTITEKSFNFIQIKNELNSIEEKIKIKRTFVLGEITNEVDEKGKSVYSNQDKRNEEMIKRLDNDEDYHNDLIYSDKLKLDIQNIEIEIGDLKNKFRIWEICSRL